MNRLKAIETLARAVPNGLPGKTRFVRALVKGGGVGGRPARVNGRHGLVYEVPDLTESVAFNLFCFGLYERPTLDTLLAALPEGGTLLDGGANIGAISLPVARLRPDARVVAVEGDPDIAACLTRNVAANGLTNVTVVNTLLGADDGAMITFYKAPERKFGMGSLGDHFGSAGVELPQRTIDGLAAEHGPIAVIKLDIEGAEALALKGAAKTIAARTAPAVVFEFQDWAERKIANQRSGDSQRILRESGYAITRIGTPDAVLPEVLTEGSGMLIARRAG